MPISPHPTDMTSEPAPSAVRVPTRRGSRLGAAMMGGGALALVGGALVDFLGGTLAGMGSAGLSVLSWQSVLYYGGAFALVIGALVRRSALRRRENS